MRPGLHDPAGACQDVTGAHGPFAPGLLRLTTMLELVRHPVGLATPYRAAARGQPSTQPPADLVNSGPGSPCGSPPAGLRQASGMTHLATHRHPGGLPARRGHVDLIAKQPAQLWVWADPQVNGT